MTKRKMPPAGAKADEPALIDITEFKSRNWHPSWDEDLYPFGPPVGREIQRTSAEWSMPMNALKDAWRRFSGIPFFRPDHLYDWLEGKGINRLDAAEMHPNEVRRMIEAESAKKAPAPPDGPWSKPDMPKQWAQVFGCSPATFIRYAKSGQIRVKKLNSKSYCVHVDDLPG